MQNVVLAATSGCSMMPGKLNSCSEVVIHRRRTGVQQAPHWRPLPLKQCHVRQRMKSYRGPYTCEPHFNSASSMVAPSVLSGCLWVLPHPSTWLGPTKVCHSIVQEVERACAEACAALSMPMPMTVSLAGGDAARVPSQLLSILRNPDAAIPLTPSLKVLF